MTDKLSYEFSDGIAHVHMDDGKANVMSEEMLGGLLEAFDRAQEQEAVVLLSGRPRMFSAGYDLKMFGEGEQKIVRVLRLGANVVLRMASFPFPVLIACTGHAIAQGAFTLLAADLRLGAAGPYKYSLNEVAIGLTIPHYGVEIARMRMQPSYFQHATITAATYTPEDAVSAGFLDQVVPEEGLLERAFEEAERLRKLNMPAHAGTKQRVRAATLRLLKDSIDQELVLPE